jgi:hypothetical protein
VSSVSSVKACILRVSHSGSQPPLSCSPLVAPLSQFPSPSNQALESVVASADKEGVSEREELGGGGEHRQMGSGGGEHGCWGRDGGDGGGELGDTERWGPGGGPRRPQPPFQQFNPHPCLPPYLGSPELVRGVTGPEPTDTLAAPTDPSCQARGLCRPSWVGDEVKTGMGKHLTPSDSAQTPTHSP